MIGTTSMAEDRPRPPAGSDPGQRDDDSVPRHRVVWDHGPLGPGSQPPPPAGPPGRGTIRMIRPNLADLIPPAEKPVDSVVEMAPTTERVPQAPLPPPPPQVLAQTAAMVHAPRALPQVPGVAPLGPP